MEASFLYTILAVGPMPPEAEKTKKPSDSLIISPSLFFLMFSIACDQSEGAISVCEG